MTTATKMKTPHSTRLANNSTTGLVVRLLINKHRELTIYSCLLELWPKPLVWCDYIDILERTARTKLFFKSAACAALLLFLDQLNS